MQIRPTAFTIGLIISSFIALFFVYTEFGIDSTYRLIYSQIQWHLRILMSNSIWLIIYDDSANEKRSLKGTIIVYHINTLSASEKYLQNIPLTPLLTEQVFSEEIFQKSARRLSRRHHVGEWYIRVTVFLDISPLLKCGNSCS